MHWAMEKSLFLLRLQMLLETINLVNLPVSNCVLQHRMLSLLLHRSPRIVDFPMLITSRMMPRLWCMEPMVIWIATKVKSFKLVPMEELTGVRLHSYLVNGLSQILKDPMAPLFIKFVLLTTMATTLVLLLAILHRRQSSSILQHPLV